MTARFGRLADVAREAAWLARDGGETLVSRDHVRKALPLLQEVLGQADCGPDAIDGVAYTAGPGLALHSASSAWGP